MSALEWEGRVAVVTGAGSGIGEGIARHAAGRGMRVVLADISRERIDAVAESITAAGGRAVPHVTDVSDPDSVAELAETTVGRLGVPSLLVNNAGLENTGLLWEVDPARWRQVQGVNVDGVFHGIRFFVPHMLASTEPSVILNTSSIGGISVGGTQAPYTVSKHAVRVLSECLSIELEEVGSPIRVCVLLPHAVRSNIFEDARSTGSEVGESSLVAMRRHLAEHGMEPEEVGRLVFDAFDRGDFWIYTHPDAATPVLEQRARTLVERLRPARSRTT